MDGAGGFEALGDTMERGVHVAKRSKATQERSVRIAMGLFPVSSGFARESQLSRGI